MPDLNFAYDLPMSGNDPTCLVIDSVFVFFSFSVEIYCFS